jgi:Zn-finger nucleic acid-binding protein
MTGAIPFIALRGCGCVFSDSAVRAVIPNLVRGPADDSAADAEPAQATCPNCGKEFDPTSPRAVLPIYASPETQTVLLEQLLVDRAAAKANKKRKAEKGDKDKSDKGDKDKGDSDEGKEKKKKKKTETKAEAAAHPAPSIKASTVGSSVHAMLAEQEKKRLAAKEGMSDAVKAMFHASGDNKGDAVDFFGRTFNRVSCCSTLVIPADMTVCVSA